MPSSILAKNRIFDYLEKRGLEKITDVNAGDWHLYILKELIDNALDADEAAGFAPAVEVTFVYDPRGMLFAQVANRATFPVEQITKILALETYASVKDYYNGLTRGQQGNGLKTVIGIPYALEHFSTGRFAVAAIPLRIEAGGKRCDVWYDVNESEQTASLQTFSQEPPAPLDGTRISLRIGQFSPSPPPSAEEIGDLARKYALWNPFASFSWNINFGGQATELRFAANAKPRVLPDPAPIGWYRFDQFAALSSRLTGNGDDVPRKLVSSFLPASDPRATRSAVDGLTKAGIRTAAALENEAQLREAYDILLRAAPVTPLERLGELGAAAVKEFATKHGAAEGTVCYRLHREAPAGNPHAPFTLEVFLFRSRNVKRRTLWTGVNFTSLYKDPFYRKKFSIHKDGAAAEIVGLDKVLGKFGIAEEDNVLVGVHLISPNVEFQSYGKGEFDCRWIEPALLKLLEDAATEFSRVNRLRPHEKAWLEAIPEAARVVSSDGKFRFSASQLFRKTKKIAGVAAPGDVSDEHQFGRFQRIVLADYQKKHGTLTGLLGDHKVKFRAPNGPFGLVVWIMKEGFEDVFLENDLVNQLEAAIVWGEVDASGLLSCLAGRLERNRSYTLLALHDADAASCARAHLAEQSLATDESKHCRFFNLGLTPRQALAMGIPPSAAPEVSAEQRRRLQECVGSSLTADDFERLVDRREQFDLNDLPAKELIEWMHGRYVEIGILENRTLSPEEVQTRLLRYLVRLARSHVERRVAGVFAVEGLIEELTEELGSELLAHHQALWPRMLESDPRTWKEGLDQFTADLVNNRLHEADVRERLLARK